MKHSIYGHQFYEHHANYCPFCKSESFVIYTRITSEGITRRRQCKECKGRWNTIEVLMDDE